VEAIKAINGDVENRAKLLEALKNVELKDVPRGPMKLDSYGNPNQNIYVRKVEKVGGELQNTVIQTYPTFHSLEVQTRGVLEAAGGDGDNGLRERGPGVPDVSRPGEPISLGV
jgi:hypothetical protein